MTDWLWVWMATGKLNFVVRQEEEKRLFYACGLYSSWTLSKKWTLFEKELEGERRERKPLESNSSALFHWFMNGGFMSLIFPIGIFLLLTPVFYPLTCPRKKINFGCPTTISHPAYFFSSAPVLQHFFPFPLEEESTRNGISHIKASPLVHFMPARDGCECRDIFLCLFLC